VAEVVLHHELFYRIERDVPLWELAEALLATDAVWKLTPRVLEQVFPGTTIDSVGVYINDVELGSLKERILVKFFFGTQRDLDEAIDRARQRLGFDQVPNRQRVVAAIVLALVLTGGAYAAKRFWLNSPAEAQIEANRITIINIGAEAAGLSPEQLRAIIDGAVTKPKDLANQAVHILRPAKGDRDGSLTLDNDNELTIAPETIAAIPSEVFPEAPREHFEDFDAVDIEIRATDLDHFNTGWAVRIPSVDGRRIRMVVDSDINPHLLVSGAVVRGDVTVVYQTQHDGDVVPRRVLLKRVHPDAVVRPPSHTRRSPRSARRR
jgi:hypothetical protein